ncbi:tyrosine-type recombinase/integrase [Brevibacillus centrosporus]|uniref:tyrosine-type recombinase/integrase n=1 Tax=Brevibacillus centrosporus TaxID=54910 RepID=UPI00158758AB
MSNIIKRAKLSFAVSPKQFRHTYITNAIDNGYDLSKVALTVGHKHLLSTLYYYYRNRKKLVESTLPYSPVQSIFGR